VTLPNITIEYLANWPEFIDELARLSFLEWQDVYQQRGQTLAHLVKVYQERMNVDRLPLTLVALLDAKLIGMVSLYFFDMPTCPDLDPWLGGLFVLPEWRIRGVATKLMQRATEEARKSNVSRLYLWTSSAESLYRNLGWQAIERIRYFGHDAVVMEMNMVETLRG